MRRSVAISLLTVFVLLACFSLAFAAKCAKCAGELPQGAKFCPQCGTKVELTNCPQCQAKRPEGAKFCPNCGEKLEQAAAGTPKRERAKQRYEGVFPVGLWGGPFRPAGEPKDDSEASKAWQRRFLQTMKEIGLNTIAAAPPSMVALAEEMGMYAIPDFQCYHVLDKAGIGKEEARAALTPLADLCKRHKNVIAGFMYADTVKPSWLEPWRLVGGVWNEMQPDVPLLTAFESAQQWREFDAAAPVGAAQGWVYVFKEGISARDALRSTLCTHTDCRDARKNMPGLPVWPWVQAFGKGWGFRWPTLAELSAVHYVLLTEGVRGAMLFYYAAPTGGKDEPETLADSNNEPRQMMRDMKAFLPTFAKMGTELLGYEVDERLLRSVPPSAAAAVYVSKTDPKKLYLMVASRDVSLSQRAKIAFDPGGQVVTQLKDFADGSTVPVRMSAKLAEADIELKPASGRLLAVVTK